MIHTYAAAWLPKSCNQCIQLRVLGAWFRRKEALQQLDTVARTMHRCALFWVSSFARKCWSTR